MLKTSTLAACLVAAATPALAGGYQRLGVLSYATANGDGTAAGGVFNYWDGTYHCRFGACPPPANTTTDDAPLYGGVGALTDGVVATQRWDAVSNLLGTGQYVGWNWRAYGDPTLTFRLVVFASQGYPLLQGVSIAVDDSGSGGVFAPTALLIDGVPYALTATPISPTAEWLTVSGLAIPGRFVTITPLHDPNGVWDFISEVNIDAVWVPEPSTWALMLLGVGMIGATLRRRADRENRTVVLLIPAPGARPQ